MRVQAGKLHQPSLIIWLLHWVSAILVLYLLSTSLASGLGVSERVSPANWMDWHLSAGSALLVITMARLWTSKPLGGLTRMFASKKLETGTIKSILLLTVFATATTGMTIFQRSPFGRTGTIFGLLPMPTLIRLNHSVHGVVIDVHIALACVSAVLAIVHLVDGLRKSQISGRSRLATMLWPWRKVP